MLHKSLVLAVAIAFAPAAAGAATAAPVAKSTTVMITSANKTAATKTVHKGKHHTLVKKQTITAKSGKMDKTPATKA
jgi:hypothetical protein